MTRCRTALLAVAALATAGALTPASAAPLIVVELFQSQGCSSCPPANANVNRLAARSGVLALSFGVTYWDQLGWKDRFATRATTDRQWAYARGLKHSNVWTPQVVINGRADVVGTRAAELDAAIASTAPVAGGPTVAVAGATLAVGAGKAPPDGADIWLVHYDPRTIEIAIKAGENGGRTLPHRNVVRELIRLGRWTGAAATLPLPAAPAGLSTAILVQTPGGPILAAARG